MLEAGFERAACCVCADYNLKAMRCPRPVRKKRLLCIACTALIIFTVYAGTRIRNEIEFEPSCEELKAYQMIDQLVSTTTSNPGPSSSRKIDANFFPSLCLQCFSDVCLRNPVHLPIVGTPCIK